MMNIKLLQSADKRALPGVPPHHRGRHHLLRHPAHGDHLAGHHRGQQIHGHE